MGFGVKCFAVVALSSFVKYPVLRHNYSEAAKPDMFQFKACFVVGHDLLLNTYGATKDGVYAAEDI